MACYSPLQAFRLADSSIVFSKPKGCFAFSLKLPCGQCIGCRLEYSRQWAIRLMHEASLHDDNCFITLTFSNEHLPSDGSLDVKVFQDFMKRFRKRVWHFSKSKIRFFHCGEYGERFKRPHYHAIIFGFDFPDKVLWENRNGHKLYRSAMLEELWPFGHSSVGSVTFDSAAYVARYICKKVNGDLADSHYRIVDFETGEILGSRKPEYTTMSRKPGIAKKWIDKYMHDTFKDDSVNVRGRSCRPPRFYDSQYELFNAEDFSRIKRERKLKALQYANDNTPERLRVKEIVKLAEIRNLKRTID